MEVVNAVQEKRAVLASWASDACAVESAPELRCPPSGPVLRYNDIINASKCLDGDAAEASQYATFMNRARRWKELYRGQRGGPRYSAEEPQQKYCGRRRALRRALPARRRICWKKPV